MVSGCSASAAGQAFVHAVCEALIVIPFYAAMAMPMQEMLRLIVLLVGVGSFVHSMIDYAISLLIWKPVSGTTMRKAKTV